MSPSHTLHQVSGQIPTMKIKKPKLTNTFVLHYSYFNLYVFALTLDLPSASIKCSTYVTSPTTNQIPETTHTKGERSRENNGGLEQKHKSGGR